MGRMQKRPNEHGQWRCTLCKEWKDPEEFYGATNTSNLLTAQCIVCLRTMRWAKQVVAGKDPNWDEFYPVATDDQIDEFRFLLEQMGTYSTRSQIGKVFQERVVAMRKTLDREQVAYIETIVQPDRWNEPERTTAVRPKPGQAVTVPGGYEVQLLGPPPSEEKPTWWDKQPLDMTDDEYREWMVSDTPSDPAERS
jgi:hypothetical protein